MTILGATDDMKGRGDGIDPSGAYENTCILRERGKVAA